MGVETLDKGGQQSPTWTLPEETEVTRSARATNETIGFLQVEMRFTSFGSSVSAGSNSK